MMDLKHNSSLLEDKEGYINVYNNKKYNTMMVCKLE